jgi:hypothetical protein
MTVMAATNPTASAIGTTRVLRILVPERTEGIGRGQTHPEEIGRFPGLSYDSLGSL